jgi:hypothetical protein
MKKSIKSLLAAALLAVSFGTISSCENPSEKLCGPCGDVYDGDAFISGNARIDGVFKAVGTFGNATAKIDANFRSELEGLAEVFGVTGAAEMSVDQLAAEVKGAINAEISANVQGGLSVEFVPPQCKAEASVAVEAQAECEASAGCEVSAECEAGEVNVTCEGECSGSCEGECEGGSLQCKAELSAEGVCEGSCEGTCQIEGPDLDCQGTCSGTCVVEAGAECTGTCTGNCTGTCDGEAVDGVACDGVCEGECDAECEIYGNAECSGTCKGKCEFTPPDGQCSGTCKGECYVEVAAEADCEGDPPHCTGTCKGTCSAECSGTITPPSCSAEGSCDASADCQAEASAQASASLECTPPSIEIGFNLKADLDAKGKAEFIAKMSELKVRMVAIVQGMFQLRALVDADYAAEIGIEPPVGQITAAVQGLLEINIDELDIPAGRLACVLPALEDSQDILVSAATDLPDTVEAQIDIVGVLGIM